MELGEGKMGEEQEGEKRGGDRHSRRKGAAGINGKMRYWFFSFILSVFRSNNNQHIQIASEQDSTKVHLYLPQFS